MCKRCRQNTRKQKKSPLSADEQPMIERGRFCKFLVRDEGMITDASSDKVRFFVSANGKPKKGPE